MVVDTQSAEGVSGLPVRDAMVDNTAIQPSVGHEYTT